MKPDTSNRSTPPTVIHGTGINSRRSAGVLRFFRRNQPKTAVGAVTGPVREERARLQSALTALEKRLEGLYQRTLLSVGREEAEIFRIHVMMLGDEDLLDELWRGIDAGKCAEDAVSEATEKFSKIFEGLGDAYLSARAADLRDIAGQLLRELGGSTSDEGVQSDEPFLLVADDLTPSETVTLEKSMILGFITFRGTPNSHTAILARAMGIPALVNVGQVDPACEGAYALLDAEEGTLTVNPDPTQRELFAQKQSKDDRIAKEHERFLRAMMNKPAITRSGHRMLIYANVGDESEVRAVVDAGGDGIGLLRSEFLYLGSADYPDEERLFAAYRGIVEGMQGKRTVIRTLDIGADKKIAYFALPEEENPALGFRAIRICLAREELFKTQLRAILRASAFGNLSLMFPMIVSLDEVRQCKRLLEECKQELRRAGIGFSSDIEVGIMIETPAAAIMSEELAQEVDFFSVGTNDLTQYTLAADRQNPALARLCEENREPVLRLIAWAAEAIHRTGGWIGICGEMAADLQLTQRFADLRIDELSVSPPYLLGLRKRVTECK